MGVRVRVDNIEPEPQLFRPSEYLTRIPGSEWLALRLHGSKVLSHVPSAECLALGRVIDQRSNALARRGLDSKSSLIRPPIVEPLAPTAVTMEGLDPCH